MNALLLSLVLKVQMINQHLSPRFAPNRQKLCFSRKQKMHSKDKGLCLSSLCSFEFDLSIKMVQQENITLDVSGIKTEDDLNQSQLIQQKPCQRSFHVPSIALQNMQKSQISRSYIFSDRSDRMSESCVYDASKTSKILQNIQNKFLIKRSQKQSSNSGKARKFVLTNKNGLLKNSQAQQSGFKIDTKELQSIRNLNKNLYSVFLQAYRALQNSIKERESIQQQKTTYLQEHQRNKKEKLILQKQIQQYEKNTQQNKSIVRNLDQQRLRKFQELF